MQPSNSTRMRAGGSLVLDQIREPLFDTYVFGNGDALAKEIRFFTEVQNKDAYLTNMRINGQLEQGVSFLIQGIGLDAHTDNYANRGVLAEIIEKGSMALRIGEKNYWEGPARFVTGRMYTEESSSTADTDLHFSQFGATAVNGLVLKGGNELVLESLQNFRLGLNLIACTKSVDTGLSLVASLKGLKRRPVQ